MRRAVLLLALFAMGISGPLAAEMVEIVLVPTAEWNRNGSAPPPRIGGGTIHLFAPGEVVPRRSESADGPFDDKRPTGIKTIAAFMVGNVDDTPETVQDSVTLAKEIRPTVFGFSVATPLPGTEFHAIAQQNGWIRTEDYRQYSEFQSLP